MKVKVESEKVGFKLNIQKMKIMASGPITSWEIDGETVETVSDPLNPLPLCSLASSPMSQQTSEQIKRRRVSVIATCVNSEAVSLFARSLLALG